MTYRLLIIWIVFALAACTQPVVTPTQQAGQSPTLPIPTATTRPEPTALPASPTTMPSVEREGWQVLYQRAGWNGGQTIDLRATGDSMLGRLVGIIARKQGYDYPFAASQVLLAGDLTLGNLESPLTERRAPLRPGPFRLPASPAFAASLKAAGFDALSLANNHALDLGPAGLHDAVSALSSAGIPALGVGASAEAALEPVFVASGGLRIALFGLNDVRDPEDQANEGTDWGRAWLNEAALQRIAQARSRADLVVVMVHWGDEYAAQPSQRQREWAHKLVGAGTDLVLGAHPHVLQPAEMLEAGGRSGFVAYSLGNFLFDQPDRIETSTSAVLRVLLDRQGVVAAAAAPIEIANGQARPLALESDASQDVLARLTVQTVSKQPTPVIPATEAQPQAWSWDGKTAQPVTVPPDIALVPPARRIPADLRGTGEPLWVTLNQDGLVEIHDGPEAGAPVVWQNEAENWRVTQIDAGDLDHDGRIEVLLLLWRPDPITKKLGSHPFLVGWRGGRFGVIWGGSATAVPIQRVRVGDLDGDGREELVVLEGGSAPGDAGQYVSIWSWSGWVFEQQWRSEAGEWQELALQDVDGNGRVEVVVH